jgi:hypothetical protein
MVGLQLSQKRRQNPKRPLPEVVSMHRTIIYGIALETTHFSFVYYILKTTRFCPSKRYTDTP